MNRLTFITTNKSKAKEASAILGVPLTIKDVEIDEIQDLDIEVVVKKKAEAAFEKIREPLFVDDVGLYITAWNGFPGPFMKHLRLAGGNDLLLRMIEKESDRTALVKGAIGFHDGETVHTFIGIVEAELIREHRGKNGWGFDPIILPKGYDKTWGEMNEEEKNRTSHRRKALDLFRKFLIKKNYSFT